MFAMFIVFGAGAFNANASSIPDGAIIKTANNPDVYIVKYNLSKWYKRLVLNPLVFTSYGHLKWENLITVSDSEMDAYVTSDLVRVDGTTDVYQLVPEGDNGGKYLLTSMDGFDADSIYTINSTDFGNYSMRGDKAARYVQEFSTRNGQVKISSNMLIKPFVMNSVEEDVPLNQLDLSTWYGFDIPQFMLDESQYDVATIEVLSKMYIVGTRIIELKDLEKLYISMESPDGSTSYAKNFKLAKIDGKWQLSSEHSGVLSAYISDDKTEERGYDWVADNATDIIPDSFQNKEFGFYLYVYTKQ